MHAGAAGSSVDLAVVAVFMQLAGRVIASVVAAEGLTRWQQTALTAGVWCYR